VRPLVFGVACCGAPPQPRAAGRHDEDQRQKFFRNVDKLSNIQPLLDHTLKEGTNLTRRRTNDLRETFTFLELSFAITNSQMTMFRRLVYKHFAAIENACESNFHLDPILRDRP
jgi:hypothetical protein